MGACCASKDPLNRAISKELLHDRKNDGTVHKLLFLGSGGSGKSTFFKQLRSIHGKGYGDNDRIKFKRQIDMQIIGQMQMALDVFVDNQHKNKRKKNAVTQPQKSDDQYTQNIPDHDDDDGDTKYSDENNEQLPETELDLIELPAFTAEGMTAADVLLKCDKRDSLNAEITKAIQILWKEKAIQIIYEMRNITQLSDSCKYFWEKVDKFARKSYVPTDNDIMLTRKRTVGLREQTYLINDVSFRIIDVGGQQSERRKWIHCFEHVISVLFVASLNCYDKLLFEDRSLNAMMDQLILFDQIINDPLLTETAMILFLNKKDLFAQKVDKVNLNVCPAFKDYEYDDGGEKNKYEHGAAYIMNAFKCLDKTEKKNIFGHLTCATDKNNVKTVFDDVEHFVLQKSLVHSGLVDDDAVIVYQ